MLQRVLEPETLDHLAPDDPAAQRSRRDLRRVNAVMGARGILRRALARVLQGGRIESDAPLRIIELGCGDGLLMLDIAQSAPPALAKAQLTLLDRQALVADDTKAAYAGAGWRVATQAIDVLDWAAAPPSARRYDIVVANLFLHHFEGDALRRVLAGCAGRADALVACEPRRSRFALAASHGVAFIGANAVTRRDAVLSVRAGFAGDELSRAWPGESAEPVAAGGAAGAAGAAGAPGAPGAADAVQPGKSGSAGAAQAWQLAEYDDGLFTHCFGASRNGVWAAAT